MAKAVSQNDLDKCIIIYDAMKSASKHITRDGYTGDVYQGKITYLFTEMGIAMPYFTPIMNALKDMGCIQQLRRGGGSSVSEWAVFFPPTNAEFKVLAKKSGRIGLKQTPADQTAQQIRDLNKRIVDLEDAVKLLTRIILPQDIDHGALLAEVLESETKG
jgi:hypothetical protein